MAARPRGGGGGRGDGGGGNAGGRPIDPQPGWHGQTAQGMKTALLHDGTHH
ncbi:hypothetical protein ACFTUC_20095 [Streptomyces sp. NPDC056944]|uniref:hypothetical protein n=1 Tax=Streptomyces sp. NPDC056944 TaxID=3345972 RepID=UPI00362906BA